MPRRRILIVNSGLALRAGTEQYVRDLATSLVARGHQVAAYSNVVGDLGEELRGDGVTVVDSLDDLPWVPELIHGQHHLETMTALLRFPVVPAIYVGHGWIPWEELAPPHPRILRYVAVDQPTRRSIARRIGRKADDVALLPNPVDLRRFRPRGALPPKPRRALFLCNYVSWESHVRPVREGCAAEGVELEARGLGVGRPERRPERVLGGFDLVFAKGRAALEAAAVGSAVVLCGSFGLGPMVTTRNMRELRTLDCDYEKLLTPLEPAAVTRVVRSYDPHDAAEVSRWIRRAAALDDLVPKIEALYEAAIEELRERGVDPLAEARAAADYVRWVSSQQKHGRTPQGAAMVLRNLLLSLRGRIGSLWPGRVRR